MLRKAHRFRIYIVPGDMTNSANHNVTGVTLNS